MSRTKLFAKTTELWLFCLVFTSPTRNAFLFFFISFLYSYRFWLKTGKVHLKIVWLPIKERTQWHWRQTRLKINSTSVILDSGVDGDQCWSRLPNPVLMVRKSPRGCKLSWLGVARPTLVRARDHTCWLKGLIGKGSSFHSGHVNSNRL